MRRRLARIFGLLVLWSVATGVALAVEDARPASPQEVEVFVRRQEGYHTFRIPALAVSMRGTILAFAEGRKTSSDDSGDIDLVLRRSHDGGQTWGPLQVIADAGPHTYGNPCPVVDRVTGRIWLPFCWNDGQNSVQENKRGTGRGEREVYLTYSDDDGATWASPKNITSSVKREEWTWYATGPGCGIQLEDGRLVIPCNHRIQGKPDDNSLSHVIYSDDHGQTWQIGGAVPEEKTNEAQVVELTDGRLLLNMRSHHGRNRRAISTSPDRGATWSPVTFDETLLDPACQASIVRLAPGKHGRARLVFANPASRQRENLTVRVSYDDGQTWPVAKVIYPGGSAYSSLAPLPNNQIGCLYEKDHYQRLVFVTIDLDWLEQPQPE